MKQFSPSRVTAYALQAIFWICYGSIIYSSMAAWNTNLTAVRRSVISELFISMSISYVNYFVLLPLLYRRGKYALYILSALSLVILLVMLRVNVIDLELSHRSVVYTYFIRTVPALGFYLVTTVIWFFNNMITAQRTEAELRNSQLDSELKFLKLQLSPHFLFNTLNNIYSMAYFSDANTAPAILKLSGMMRHMLYEGQTKFISLSKEIAFMENFVELWRLKLDDKPQIRFSHTGVRDHHQIAHLIFLVFLENAFKHGNTINGSIDIRLSVDENELLHLYIRNDVLEGRNTLDEKSGVGLANVKKRLELIYPGKHTLILTPHAGAFEVHLTIDLK